jgi:CysZ protein
MRSRAPKQIQPIEGSPDALEAQQKKVKGGIATGIAAVGKKVVTVGTAPMRSSVTVAKGFWYGFAFPWKGAWMVYLKHPWLVRFWIWPVMITIACIAAVGYSVFSLHGDLLAWMWSAPQGQGFWVDAARVARPVVQVLVFLLLMVLGVLVVYLMSSVLAGPFNGMLSEEIERLVKGNEAQPFTLKGLLRDLLLTVRLEGGKAVVYCGVMGPLLLASLLIPGLGQGLYTIFGVFFTMIFFAVDYTDWPLARRGHGVRARLRLVRAHAPRMFGLGVGVWLLLTLPFINLLFMPAAVAGGTLMVLDMEGDGLLPEPGLAGNGSAHDRALGPVPTEAV